MIGFLRTGKKTTFHLKKNKKQKTGEKQGENKGKGEFLQKQIGKYT